MRWSNQEDQDWLIKHKSKETSEAAIRAACVIADSYIFPVAGFDMSAVKVVKVAELIQAAINEEVGPYRTALGEAAIPLEALHGAERGGWALSPDMQQSIQEAVGFIRRALFGKNG